MKNNRITAMVYCLTLLSLSACNQPASATRTANFPVPDPSSTATAPDNDVVITVFFTHMDRFAIGTEPYEEAVQRRVPVGSDLPETVLQAYFAGPTAAERTRSLRSVLSGFNGYSELRIEEGIAHVYLQGNCANNGAAFSIANMISINLIQFPEILYVKIYDEDRNTEQPFGAVNSIPYCLEP